MRHAAVGASLLLLMLGSSVAAEGSSTRWVVPQGVVGSFQTELEDAAKNQGLLLRGLDVQRHTILVKLASKTSDETTFAIVIERDEKGPILRLKEGDPSAFKALEKRLLKLDLNSLFIELKEPTKKQLPNASRADGAFEEAVNVVKARLSGRVGHGPWLKETLAPEVAKLLDQLRTGEHTVVQEESQKLLKAPNPPPGIYSLFLAAGGDAPTDLRQALLKYPLEPRLHVLRAQQYLEAGQRQLAAESLFLAMRLPLADSLAREEAEKLGMEVAESWPEAIPGGSVPETLDLSLGWFILFGLLALCMLVIAVRARSLSTAAAIVAGVAAAFLAIEPAGDIQPTAIPDTLLAPLAGGPCGTGAGRINNLGYAVDAFCPSRTTTLVVTPAQQDTWSFAQTKHHHINLQNGDVHNASPDLLQATALLKEALTGAEKEGFRLPEATASDEASGTLATEWALLSDSSRAELRVGAGVVVASVLLLLFLLLGQLRSVFSNLRSETKWVWLLLTACLCLYLLVPSRMLMVYSGYDRVDALAQGELPRYGITSLFFYGPFLWFGGIDHAWLQGINRLLGLGCLVVAWDLGRVLFKMDRRTSWLSALLLVSMPLFVRGFTSEAISPFPTLCLLVALRTLSQPPPRNLAAAALLLVCAAMGRPEIAAAVVFVPLWFYVTDPGRLREEAPWLVFGALILVVALQVARTLLVTEDLASREALPLASNPFGAAFHVLTFKSAHASIDYTPLGFTPLVLAGAWFTARRAALAILVVAAVWLGATGIDLVRVSIPRLHLGPILLLTPLAAIGAMTLLEKAQARGANPGRVLASLLAALWVSGLALNAQALFSPVTEEAEERLWRDTVDALPEEPGCLIRYGFGDPSPSPKTPLYSPDYLLPKGWKTAALSELESVKKTCAGSVYVLLGTHCYTHLRPPDTPPPSGLDEREVCTQVRTRTDLQPVFEREADNEGEPPGLRLFPEAKTLPIGLYELVR